MTDVQAAVDAEADEIGFTGAIRVDVGGHTVVDAGYGFADRANAISNTASTRFAMASGSKGFTALTVIRLVEEGALNLDTTARSLLGADLPMVADAVTVEHLLGHRSGIGDYLDEDDDEGEITDTCWPVPCTSWPPRRRSSRSRLHRVAGSRRRDDPSPE